jgi:hypothetical protein
LLPQDDQYVNQSDHRQTRVPEAGLHQQIVGLRFEAPRRESNHCDKKQHVESPRAITNSKDKRAAPRKRDLTRNLRWEAITRSSCTAVRHAELPSNAAATLMCAYMCGRIAKSGALRH